jgi:hypothetical protein
MATMQTDVGFDNAPVVDDECVGHHGVYCATRLRASSCTVPCALGLRHAVADGFAAAELHFFAVASGFECEVVFDFNDQIGVRQAQAVANGGAIHFCVSAFTDGCHYLCPLSAAR